MIHLLETFMISVSQKYSNAATLLVVFQLPLHRM